MAETKIISQDILDATVTSTDMSATGVVAGPYTNTNLTVDAQGRITAAANGSGLTSGNFVDNETPTRTGASAVYTLANTPVLGSQHVYKNGVRMFPGVGNDYVIAGAVITFTTNPTAGAVIVVDYRI